MTVNWDNYEPYVPPYWGPPEQLSRRQARESYDDVMASKPERIALLRGLLAANGIELSISDSGIQEVTDWFRENVEPDSEDPSRLGNLWYAVVFDVGIFLGEAVIERTSSLYWEFFTYRKKSVSYQKPVIMGFSAVSNSKYNVDFDRIVATFGHRVVQGLDVESDEFAAAVRECEDDA